MGEIAALWDLFREPLIASLAAALVLPLVGALVFLRRSVFLGVAVPQFSMAGLSLGFLLLPAFPSLYAAFHEHGHPPSLYTFGFAAAAAALALWAYSVLQTRVRTGSPEGRLAAGFALASALSLVFLTAGPVGVEQTASLLHGEVLQVDRHGLEILLAVFAAVVAGLWRYRRAFLLIAFDPDGAVSLGLPVSRYERVQMLLVGLAVGGGVMTLGPVLVFGLLFLPPLAARMAARTMRSFLVHASCVGFLSCVLAWPASYWARQPYGPSAVVLSGVAAAGYWIVGQVGSRRSRQESFSGERG